MSEIHGFFSPSPVMDGSVVLVLPRGLFSEAVTEVVATAVSGESRSTIASEEVDDFGT